MAGILKSIQKKSRAEHSKKGEREGLLTLVASDENDRQAESTPYGNKKASAERLLKELMDESETSDLNHSLSPEDLSVRSGAKIVKRHQVLRVANHPVELRESSLPDWVKPVSKLPAHLEATYLEVVKKLNKKIVSLGHLPTLQEELFKQVIAEVHTDLNLDANRTWKDQDLIERELKNIISIDIQLDQLLYDEYITEIFYDSYKNVKVRRKGQLIETPFSFRNVDEYEIFLNSILSSSERILSSDSPILEFSLKSNITTNWAGSIVHCIHSSLSPDGEHHLAIKVLRTQSVSFYDLLQLKVLPATVAAWLAECISQGDANILIIGTKDSGKDLITAALASEIGSHERTIIVENMPEIQFSTANAEKLSVLSTSLSSEANMASLIKSAVRRHPDRLIATNLKDHSAMEFLRALESGLTGCIASAQGEYPEDGLWRLFDEVNLANPSSQSGLLRRISRSIDIVVSMGNYDSKPCLVEIAEVLPIDGRGFRVLPLLQLESINDGKRLWRITAEDSHWLRRTSEKGGGLRSGPGVSGYGVN